MFVLTVLNQFGVLCHGCGNGPFGAFCGKNCRELVFLCFSSNKANSIFLECSRQGCSCDKDHSEPLLSCVICVELKLSFSEPFIPVPGPSGYPQVAEHGSYNNQGQPAPNGQSWPKNNNNWNGNQGSYGNPAPSHGFS